MPVTIIPQVQPAGAQQHGHLQTLFASPGYSLLKEVIAAHCIKAQVDAMNAALYSENDRAKEESQRFQKLASRYNSLLDLLDDLDQNEQDWITIKLDTRR